eukprot:CAMPEP_0185771898 /NCGR_PEP_ID=MMETSP1174-20130828/65775_1 /TAXON_ID=35687 /ORGANISM="Dictyocha speculum, Strain CCMP1381" /LENGTH=218 /DNA_ID=CAMNT_0028457917 /DNA_START=103 /DNA_END=759 /DNA_ORIENTATION=+
MSLISSRSQILISRHQARDCRKSATTACSQLGMRVTTKRMVSASSFAFVPAPSPPMNPLFETAQSALEKSCYLNMDWKIKGSEMVSEAVKVMTTHKIGALAVIKSGEENEVIGIISERDYLTKVAFRSLDPNRTRISEVCTLGAEKLVSVTKQHPIDVCMEKILSHNIRHLLIREEETGSITGMISVKDVVKCANEKQKAKLNHLEHVLLANEISRGL